MKNYFLFIIFDDIYLMKNIINVYIIEFLDIFNLIHDLNKRNRIIIFDNHLIKNLIIYKFIEI